MVMHAVAAQAALGALGRSSDSSWRDSFSAAWEAQCEKVRLEVRVDGPAEAARWRNYGVARAGTKRLAAALADLGSARDVRAEVALRSADGLLRGRADLVVLDAPTEVIDFKSAQAGELPPAWRLQLELYGYLVTETLDLVPERLSVMVLGQGPTSWAAGADRLQMVAAETRQLLRRYNAAAARSEVSVLAEPGPDMCRWCRYAPRCPAFWESVNAAWWRDVLSFYGTVQDVRVARRGTGAYSIRCSETGATLELSGVDADRASVVRVGDEIAVVGARGLGACRASMLPSTRLALTSTSAH
jgi:hypothetical protein